MPTDLDAAPADLVLNPAARILWRAPDAVQLELGDQAVVVEGIDPAFVRSVLPRYRHTAEVSVRSAQLLPRRAALALTDAGFLLPVGSVETDSSHPPVPRLASELMALAARRGAEAAALLERRRAASVAVHGAGRVAVQTAAVLAASGVGRVYLTDAGDVRLHQTAPGGLVPADEGTRFAAAGQAAILRAAPDTITAMLPMGETPELSLLAVDEPIDGSLRDALHARAGAHLAVRVGPSAGVVGPLVVPGRTSCLRCADLHRRDRDDAWPALAAQLTVPPRHGAASMAALATVIAGLAAAQSLAFLDDGMATAVNATVEIHPPDWRIRRRSWTPHPNCGCSATSPP